MSATHEQPQRQGVVPLAHEVLVDGSLLLDDISALQHRLDWFFRGGDWSLLLCNLQVGFFVQLLVEDFVADPFSCFIELVFVLHHSAD
jgi:hypothetical protein